MKKITSVIILIISLSLIILVESSQFAAAPQRTIKHLTAKGYSQVEIKDVLILARLDLCGQHAKRVTFSAIKDHHLVSGYVCLDYIFPNSIYED